MSNDKPRDGDPTPEKKQTGGNGEDKPGLVIDVVLPPKKPEAEPDLGKKH